MTSRYVLKRSVLYTPASRIDRVRKALESGAADIVVADLEDGTAPAQKEAARADVGRLLLALPKSRSTFAIRINPWPSDEAKLDVEMLVAHPPAVLLVPKAEDALAVAQLVDGMVKRGAAPQFFLLAETAKGVLSSEYLAHAPHVTALIFGSEDYAANVGAVRTPDGLEILWARSHVVAAAASAGIDAVDQVWPDFHDPDGLRRDAQAGARLGYTGKQLIHPDQVAPVHEAFAPSAQEFEKARRVVEASEAAGGGVVVVDGRMIDRPLVEQARRVLWRGQAPR